VGLGVKEDEGVLRYAEDDEARSPQRRGAAAALVASQSHPTWNRSLDWIREVESLRQLLTESATGGFRALSPPLNRV
jgi:hypothetical protein